jgi:hypothetical protein
MIVACGFAILDGPLESLPHAASAAMPSVAAARTQREVVMPNLLTMEERKRWFDVAPEGSIGSARGGQQ